MPKSEIFRVNYYVGALLAQGGNVWIDDDVIIFSPTSAIDRAMGAKDVHIPFSTIREREFKGDLLRTFTVTATDKTHKFEGSQAKKVWDYLDKAMQGRPSAAATAAAPANGGHAAPAKGALVCDTCASRLEAGYGFCPACGTRIKAICPSCHKAVMASWVACAFCGWKFSGKTAS